MVSDQASHPEARTAAVPVAVQINVWGHHNQVHVDRSAIEMALPSARVASERPFSAWSRLWLRVVDFAGRGTAFGNEAAAAASGLLSLLGAA